MNQTRSLVRQDKIRWLLSTKQEMSVQELAAELDVSSWTVRRDLDHLVELCLVRRSHGKARVRDDNAHPTLFPQAIQEEVHAQLDAKERIGRCAAQLLANGQYVVLGGGMTTLHVARAMGSYHQISVMTNSLHIALQLAELPGCHVMSTGGDFDRHYATLTGPIAEQALRAHFFDVAMIEVSGVNGQTGLMVNSPLNAVTLKLMIEHASKVIVLIDHTKIGRICFVPLAPLNAIDVLVTDREPHAAFQQQLRAADVHLIVSNGSETLEPLL